MNTSKCLYCPGNYSLVICNRYFDQPCKHKKVLRATTEYQSPVVYLLIAFIFFSLTKKNKEKIHTSGCSCIYFRYQMITGKGTLMTCTFFHNIGPIFVKILKLISTLLFHNLCIVHNNCLSVSSFKNGMRIKVRL